MSILRTIIKYTLLLSGLLFWCVLAALVYAAYTYPQYWHTAKMLVGTSVPLVSETVAVPDMPQSSEAVPEEGLVPTEMVSVSEPKPKPKPFTLTAEQKAALTTVGIDPNTIPTTISNEMEQCFIGVLGAGRVLDIRAGAVPSILEFAAVVPCI